jgi:hypothetical protein
MEEISMFVHYSVTVTMPNGDIVYQSNMVWIDLKYFAVNEAQEFLEAGCTITIKESA